MEIDLGKIESELGIGKEIVVELLKEFLKESEGMLTKLDAAVASGDYAVMTAAAHSLKGSSGNLRVTSIEDAARAFEMSAREKKDKAVMEPQLVALKGLHAELKKLLS